MADTLADLVVSLRADFGDVAKQTDDLSKDLKDLGAQAKATGAAVGTDLNSQLDQLFAKGMTLAEALKSLEAPLEGVGSSASAAAEQMGLFGEEMQVPFADAGGQLNLFSGELEQVIPAAEGASEALTKYTFEAKEAGMSSFEAFEHAHGLLVTLLEFAGIRFAIEELKAFAEEAVEVFTHTEKVQFALGFMAKSAEEGAKQVEGLKATAQALAVPFEPLLGIAQKFSALGVSAEETTVAITAAGDASKVSFFGFEQIASSISRLSQNAVLGKRQLVPLALTMDDVAKSMGVSVDQVSDKFKDSSLKIEDRVNILSKALEDKFGGAAVKSMDLLGNQMTVLKNQWTFALEQMGEALAPLVREVLPQLAAVIKDAMAQAILFVTGIKMAVDYMSAYLHIAAEGVKGYALVWKNVLKGDFTEAAASANDAFMSIRAYGKKAWDSMIEDGVAGGEQLKKLFAPLEPAAAPKIPSGGGAGAAGAAYKEESAQIDNNLHHQLAAYALEKIAFEELHSENLKNGIKDAAEFAGNQLANIKKVAAAEVAALVAKQELDKKAKTETLTNLQLQGKEQAVVDKAAEQSATVRAKQREAENAEQEKLWKQFVASQHEALAKMVKEWDKHDAHVAKLNKELTADLAKEDLNRIKGDQAHGTAQLETRRAVYAAELSAHQITVFQKLALDKQLDDQESADQVASLAREIENYQRKAVAGKNYYAEIQRLRNQQAAIVDKGERKDEVAAVTAQIEPWKLLGVTSQYALQTQVAETAQAIDGIERQGATTMELLEARKKLLDQEIKMKEQQGAGSGAEVIALANTALATDALITKSRGLGDVYAGLTKDFQNAFRGLGTELTQAIMQTKSFAAAFISAGQSIASSILNTIIGGGLKKLESEIVIHLGLEKSTSAATVAANKLIAGSYAPVGIAGAAAFGQVAASASAAFAAVKIALSSQNVQAVISYEAVFDAATMAAYAGIPFVGEGIAAGIIATAMPIFAGLAITAGVAKGGAEIGDKEMLTILHPRELVLPEPLSVGIKNLIGQGTGPALAAAGAGGAPIIHVDFANAHISGVTDSLVDQLGKQIVYRVRQLLGSNVKF